MTPRALDESSRLKALRRYGILDSDAEPAFDELARLAAMICDAPMAAITFVDDQREWFKARHGLSLTDLPRATSFCDDTFRHDGVLVIADALREPRFAGLSPTADIGFYAGAPLRSADGHALGALCVFDVRERRTLTTQQVESLAALARQVEAQLALRLQLARTQALTEAQRALGAALAESPDTTDAARRALAVMASHVGASVGGLWLPDAEHEALQCEALWTAGDMDASAFTSVTQTSRLAKGEGLPGRVWLHGRPEWVPDVTADASFLRGEAARAAGLRSGVAIPVLTGPLVLGVFDFFTPEARAFTPGELALFEGLASQFGEFMLRQQAEDVMRFTEDRVRQREARLDLLVRTMAEGLLFAQSDGTVAFANDAAARITGQPKSVLQGTRLDDPRWRMFKEDGTLYRPDELPAVSALQTGKAARNVVVGIRPGYGNMRWLMVNVEPVGEGEGAPVLGAVITFRDITDWKEAEAALKAAKEEAESATRAKSEFLAVMSHEIRTPMNGVLGMVTRAIELAETPDQRQVLELARSSAEALLGITNDILDFSKVTAGRLELEEVAFDPCLVADEVAQTMLSLARPGVAVRVVHEQGHLGGALGDGGRLRQILLNLCGNAVKFTRTGYVEIRTSRAVDDRGALFRFVVVDTGIGIPADRQEAIFEAFTQADASTTRQFGGSGLGLAICAKLATLMGGTLRLVASSPAGSAFEVTLPMRRTALQEAPRGLVRPPRRFAGRVLVVDDTFVNQQVAAAMLKRAGCTADLAGGGSEALEMIERFSYDLVLMDCRMPDVDGYDTTRELRRLGHLRLPIVAMTAGALPGDRQRCLDAGMNDYLTKPVMQDTLEEALSRFLTVAPTPIIVPAAAPIPASAQAPAPAGREPAHRLGQMRSLLMASSPDAWRQLTHAFRAQCRDAVPALAAAARRDDLPSMRELAHGLEGSAGMIGAVGLSQLCHQVESAAASGDGTPIPDLLLALEEEVRSVERLLSDEYA